MRIIHFSDWHWFFQQLPEADLYVVTGDMLDNYPARIITAYGSEWTIDKKRERAMQKIAIHDFVAGGGFRPYLGSPDAPIVAVRGNHDFVDIAGLFKGCNFRQEFINNESIELLGMTITGHRGIPYIAGTWSDETSHADLMDRVRRMPDADLYLTHYGPNAVLDGSHYGLMGMSSNLIYRNKTFLHCFGHVHENGGLTLAVEDDENNQPPSLFSNAACNINVLEGSPKEGWKQV